MILEIYRIQLYSYMISAQMNNCAQSYWNPSFKSKDIWWNVMEMSIFSKFKRFSKIR